MAKTKKPFSKPKVTLRPKKSGKETLAVIHYPDGRIWEIRIGHHLEDTNCCIPTVWHRLLRNYPEYDNPE